MVESPLVHGKQQPRLWLVIWLQITESFISISVELVELLVRGFLRDAVCCQETRCCDLLDSLTVLDPKETLPGLGEFCTQQWGWIRKIKRRERRWRSCFHWHVSAWLQVWRIPLRAPGWHWHMFCFSLNSLDEDLERKSVTMGMSPVELIIHTKRMASKDFPQWLINKQQRGALPHLRATLTR